jgi:hypothetical protein
MREIDYDPDLVHQQNMALAGGRQCYHNAIRLPEYNGLVVGDPYNTRAEAEAAISALPSRYPNHRADLLRKASVVWLDEGQSYSRLGECQNGLIHGRDDGTTHE